MKDDPVKAVESMLSEFLDRPSEGIRKVLIGRKGFLSLMEDIRKEGYEECYQSYMIRYNAGELEFPLFMSEDGESDD